MKVKYGTCYEQLNSKMSKAEKPTIAFALSLIAGILIVLGGAARYAIGMFVHSYGSRISGNHHLLGAITSMIGAGLGFFGLVGAVLGIVVIVSAIMLYGSPDQHVTWGTVIIVLSIVSLFVGASGFLLGLVLGVVGGILAITWKPATP